jgi:hypothetical protein
MCWQTEMELYITLRVGGKSGGPGDSGYRPPLSPSRLDPGWACYISVTSGQCQGRLSLVKAADIVEESFRAMQRCLASQRALRSPFA